MVYYVQEIYTLNKINSIFAGLLGQNLPTKDTFAFDPSENV